MASLLFVKRLQDLIALKQVNLSKRGGKDTVFQGLVGLIQGISQRSSTREIPRSSPASPIKIAATTTARPPSPPLHYNQPHRHQNLTKVTITTNTRRAIVKCMQCGECVYKAGYDGGGCYYVRGRGSSGGGAENNPPPPQYLHYHYQHRNQKYTTTITRNSKVTTTKHTLR